MSKQIHDESRRESGRDAQVKVRVDSDLLDAFDTSVSDSDYGNRSDAIRSLMRQQVSGTSTTDTPRKPPQDEPLATAYLTLCDICNADGVIRDDIAETELATTLGKRKEIIKHSVLDTLRDRGYLSRMTNVYGDASWKLRGWDEC